MEHRSLQRLLRARDCLLFFKWFVTICTYALAVSVVGDIPTVNTCPCRSCLLPLSHWAPWWQIYVNCLYVCSDIFLFLFFFLGTIRTGSWNKTIGGYNMLFFIFTSFVFRAPLLTSAAFNCMESSGTFFQLSGGDTYTCIHINWPLWMRKC